jgi:hypothetical protein
VDSGPSLVPRGRSLQTAWLRSRWRAAAVTVLRAALKVATAGAPRAASWGSWRMLPTQVTQRERAPSWGTSNEPH